jgi:hypothetical protein
MEFHDFTEEKRKGSSSSPASPISDAWSPRNSCGCLRTPLPQYVRSTSSARVCGVRCDGGYRRSRPRSSFPPPPARQILQSCSPPRRGEESPAAREPGNCASRHSPSLESPQYLKTTECSSDPRSGVQELGEASREQLFGILLPSLGRTAPEPPQSSRHSTEFPQLAAPTLLSDASQHSNGDLLVPKLPKKHHVNYLFPFPLPHAHPL